MVSKDGLGYDILSFDKNGKEKYIEVKGTTTSLPLN
ncbi:protein NO VEIN domain-containing protein [Spiroplasma mirum]